MNISEFALDYVKIIQTSNKFGVEDSTDILRVIWLLKLQHSLLVSRPWQIMFIEKGSSSEFILMLGKFIHSSHQLKQLPPPFPLSLFIKMLQIVLFAEIILFTTFWLTEIPLLGLF